MTCLLCKKLDTAGSGAENQTVYEDDVAVVLVDAARARRGQAWVIPKTHYAALDDMDERTGVHLIKLGMRAAASLGTQADEALEVLLESETSAANSHVHVRVCSKSDCPGPRSCK